MAQFQISTPQGSAIVNAPAGSTREEVIALFNRTMAAEARRPQREREEAIKRYFQTGIDRATQTALSREASVGDYLGEIPKGIIGGAAGLVEAGALGLAALLPEEAENVVRSGIQSAGKSVQDYVSPDIGLRDSIPRKVSEGLGSFVGLLGTSVVNPLAGAGLAVSAGAGIQSERARAEDATLE